MGRWRISCFENHGLESGQNICQCLVYCPEVPDHKVKFRCNQFKNLNERQELNGLDKDSSCISYLT